MKAFFSHKIYVQGHELTVDVKAEANVYWENYGADADGNRGQMQVFVDEVDLTITDGRNNDITAKLLEKKYRVEAEAIEERAVKMLHDEFLEE